MTDRRPTRTPAPPNYPSSVDDSPQEFVGTTPTPEECPVATDAATTAAPVVFWLGVNGKLHTCTLDDSGVEDGSVVRVNRSKSRTVSLVCTRDYLAALSGLTVAVYDPHIDTQLWRVIVDVPIDERPLSRVMGAVVDGETLFVCAGYHVLMKHLSDGFSIGSESLREFLPSGTGPSFSTLLLCNRSMFIGLPRTCVCFSRGHGRRCLWDRPLCAESPSRVSSFPQPGDIPTFAALSDERIMVCCGGRASAVSTADGNNTNEPLVLAPEWHGPMLTLYDKAMDKGRAFVLVRDTLWAVSVYDDETFKEDRHLRVFSTTRGSQQISMAWDPESKLIFVAGYSEIVCVTITTFEVKWRKHYKPEDKSALVLRFDKKLQRLVFSLASQVRMFDPDDGTQIITTYLPPLEEHSYCVTLCTQESSYDINASGFLHNNFIASLFFSLHQ